MCGFAICGLAHLRNLRICNLQIDQKTFADKKFTDSHTFRNCGFAIADWAQICGFAICGIKKKHLRTHLCFWQIAFSYLCCATQPRMCNYKGDEPRSISCQWPKVICIHVHRTTKEATLTFFIEVQHDAATPPPRSCCAGGITPSQPESSNIYCKERT